MLLNNLHQTIDRYPYNNFPVEIDGKLKGIVTRQQILESLINKETPEIRKVVTCFPDQTVREIGDKFVESPVNVLVVVDKENDEAIRGIITLHDLIRAQASIQT
jgi:CBS domain-containing protein